MFHCNSAKADQCLRWHIFLHVSRDKIHRHHLSSCRNTSRTPALRLQRLFTEERRRVTFYVSSGGAVLARLLSFSSSRFMPPAQTPVTSAPAAPAAIMTGAVAPDVLTIIRDPTSATPYSAAAAAPIFGTVRGALLRWVVLIRSTIGASSSESWSKLI